MKTNLLDASEVRTRLEPLLRAGDMELAILFGSVARGTAREKSDLDLAFRGRSVLDITALTSEAAALLGTHRVDAVDLRRASPLLCFAVVKTGILLHESSPGSYSSFCSLAFRRYADTKKLRDARRAMIDDFLASRRPA